MCKIEISEEEKKHGRGGREFFFSTALNASSFD
jgi:YHS domain-containing protein